MTTSGTKRRHLGCLGTLGLLALSCGCAAEGPVLTRVAPQGTAGSGGSGCGHPGELACLDFEDSSLPIPSLVLAGQTGTAVYDATSSAVGMQSVKISTGAGSNYVIELRVDPPITAGQVHLRAMFWLPSGVDPASYVVLMEANDPQAARKISFDWRPNDFGINASSAANYGMSQLPKDRWFCAELSIDVDPTMGSARLTIDGALAASVEQVDTTLGSGLVRYRVGLNEGVGNPSLEIHVDDFVVATEPIGCP
jgi:hypothetical protein